MLKHLAGKLQNLNVVLASSSPRRQELLQNIGLKTLLCPSTFEETLNPEDYGTFAEFVEATANGKVSEVFDRLVQEGKRPDLVIGADTMVTLGDKMYGKPKDATDAFNTLKILSGKFHTVYTGVVIKTREKVISFSESTKVFIGELSDDEITAYINTGEPFDKAGSYGIQGIGGCIVEKIEGDYFTVVGLPLYRLSKEIERKQTKFDIK